MAYTARGVGPADDDPVALEVADVGQNLSLGVDSLVGLLRQLSNQLKQIGTVFASRFSLAFGWTMLNLDFQGSLRFNLLYCYEVGIFGYDVLSPALDGCGGDQAVTPWDFLIIFCSKNTRLFRSGNVYRDNIQTGELNL